MTFLLSCLINTLRAAYLLSCSYLLSCYGSSINNTYIRRPRSSKMAPSDTSRISSYSSSIVTMAVFCTVFGIKQDSLWRPIGHKTSIFHNPFHLTCTITYTPWNIFSQNSNTNCPSPYKFLDGAKILPKILTLWVGRNNVTDDRHRRTAHAIRQT